MFYPDKKPGDAGFFLSGNALFEDAEWLAQGQEGSAKAGVQHHGTAAVKRQQGGRHFCPGSNDVRGMRSNTEGIERQCAQQNIDHHHVEEDQLADLHGSNGHHDGKDEIGEKRKTQLDRIAGSRQFRAENAHFNHPGTGQRIPEKGKRAEYRGPPDVLMKEIQDAGHQLARCTQKNGINNDKGQAIAQAKLLRRSNESYDRQAKKAQPRRVGKGSSDAGCRTGPHWTIS